MPTINAYKLGGEQMTIQTVLLVLCVLPTVFVVLFFLLPTVLRKMGLTPSDSLAVKHAAYHNLRAKERMAFYRDVNKLKAEIMQENPPESEDEVLEFISDLDSEAVVCDAVRSYWTNILKPLYERY